MFSVTWCGGHSGLAHPHSQDSLLPICHLLINTETDSRVKWLVEKFSQCVCVCVTRSECSKQAAGNIQCARGEVVLTCECVLCVGNCIPTTTTGETTRSLSLLASYFQSKETNLSKLTSCDI